MQEVKRYTLAGIELWVVVEENAVKRISFSALPGVSPQSPVWKKVDDFVEAYEKGKDPSGIPFPLYSPPENRRLDFYLFLQSIPRGEVRSYGEIAEAFFGSKRYARVVGNYLAMNRWPILFPCHRVVRADGSPGGFTGGVEIKEKLLKWEKEGKI